jgi:MYXO-CTERM domain-containing protein
VPFVDMAMNIPDASEPDLSVPLDLAPPNNNFRLTGGGIGCDIADGGTRGAGGVIALLMASLAALLLRRRRRSS